MGLEAPQYRLPLGKPVVLLIRSDKHGGGRNMDVLFNQLKSRHAGRIRFVSLSWESKLASSAINEFVLQNPPGLIVADARAGIVAKYEGKAEIAQVEKAIKTAMERKSRKAGGD